MNRSCAAGQPISQRYLDALDAYEEYLLLRDLRDRLDEATLSIRRHRRNDNQSWYITMSHTDDAAQYARLWYIEWSPARADEAKNAVDAAVKKYSTAFRDAMLHRNHLRNIVIQQGLPEPSQVRNDSNDRPLHRPWWRRHSLLPRSPATAISDEPPIGTKYQALNIPDPGAAIEFWRTNTTAAAQKRHGSNENTFSRRAMGR